MAIPTGADLTIYNAHSRELQKRIAVSLSEPQWTAAVEELFGADISSTHLAHSQLSAKPLVTLGRAKIRGYGGPPFEWIASRRFWFPTDTTKAFKVRIIVAFPQTDPVYPQVITIGSHEQTLGGVEFDSCRLVQMGSAYAGPANPDNGKFFIHGAGQLDAVGQAYSSADHTLLVAWNPDAVGTPGAHKLTISWDGATVKEGSDAGFVAAPKFWKIGHAWPILNYPSLGGTYVAGLGTVAAPAVLMDIASVEVLENGDGYQTAAWPGWTSTNTGKTIDTAPVGERFTQDGEEWAIIPPARIKASPVGGSSREGIPNMTLNISPMRASGTDFFQSEKWVGRTITVDTRMLNDAGTGNTGWKRLGAFKVQRAERDGLLVTLDCMSRAAAVLDVPVFTAYQGETEDADAVGENDDVVLSLNYAQIFQNHVEIVSGIRADYLGVPDTQLYLPDLVPRALDNPGYSGLQWMLSIADRLVQEVYFKHATSGTGRYGQFCVNLWSFGGETGASSHTFYVRGGATRAVVLKPGVKIVENGRGPGQALYRQNNPLQTEKFLTMQHVPLVGTFPSGVYPDGGRLIDDSLSEVASSGYNPLVSFPDRTGGYGLWGGIAYYRYFQESVERLRVEFKVVNQDWMEVGDEIVFSDSEGSNPAGTFLITNVAYQFTEKNKLIATVSAVTTDLNAATDIAE